MQMAIENTPVCNQLTAARSEWMLICIFLTYLLMFIHILSDKSNKKQSWGSKNLEQSTRLTAAAWHWIWTL